MNALDDAIQSLRGLYRRGNPYTSKEAAGSIVKSITAIQGMVLAYAHSRGPTGFTDEEMNAAFSIYGSTLRSRRAELTAKGAIVPSEMRRRTAAGRNAVVWIHKEFDQ